MRGIYATAPFANSSVRMRVENQRETRCDVRWFSPLIRTKESAKRGHRPERTRGVTPHPPSHWRHVVVHGEFSRKAGLFSRWAKEAADCPQRKKDTSHLVAERFCICRTPGSDPLRLTRRRRKVMEMLQRFCTRDVNTRNPPRSGSTNYQALLLSRWTVSFYKSYFVNHDLIATYMWHTNKIKQQLRTQCEKPGLHKKTGMWASLCDRSSGENNTQRHLPVGGTTTKKPTRH